jgi:ABC-type transport system substrate-binding protein/tetratricopeptide (TPR) repeat protein
MTNRFPKMIREGLRWGIFLPAAMILCSVLRAEVPLYEQDPYDLVTLKETVKKKPPSEKKQGGEKNELGERKRPDAMGGLNFIPSPEPPGEKKEAIEKNEPAEKVILKVLPLDLPERKVPEKPRRGEKIRLRLYDEPDKLYEVEWNAIERVEFFEGRVLKAANDLVAAKKFDEAYDYFQFLQGHYPKMPGLKKAWEESLYEEAKWTFSRQEYDAALALLREVYACNPQRPGLDKALGSATEKLIEQYYGRKQYAAVRDLLRGLSADFPEHPTVVAWKDRLKKEAETAFHAAEAAAQAGDWSSATRQCRRITAIWPDYPGAKELAEAVYRQYPRVVVGVMTPWSPQASSRLADESLRRTTRLCYRTLTEYLGPGTEGGQYRCPLGEIRREALGRKLLVRLQPNIRFVEGAPALTGYDLTRRLREMTQPTDPAYSLVWSELLRSVTVQSVYTVEVELSRPYVRPEALLQALVVPQEVGEPAFFTAPANGPFSVPVSSRTSTAGTPPGRDGAEVVFSANPLYFATPPMHLRQLVERHYSLGSAAIHDLKNGAVQVLDRVAPWELPRLQGVEGLIVGRYAVPRVHCLIPNFRRPLTGQRSFRRALIYGINREAALQQLLGEQPLEGCRVLSGPFPAGTGFNDPLGYAYNEQIAPRPYDPRLALALAGSAVLEWEAEISKAQKTAAEAGRDTVKTAAAKKRNPAAATTLVLAYPEEEVAQAACASIKKQLALLGLTVELRPLPGPFPRQIPEEADLLYAALAIGEPVADAQAIFGDGGLAGGCSPYLRLALHQLNQATNWEQAQAGLFRIHRLVHEEAALIPLWQLYDFYAYRKEMHGIGERLVTLYQNVEQWQMSFHYPAEKE